MPNQNCPKHNPKISCLVNHPDGKCPGYPDNAACSCANEKTDYKFSGQPSWEEEFDTATRTI